MNSERFGELQQRLVEGAHIQDAYDLNTTCLIAPASPTSRRYIDIPLQHAAIAEGLLGKRPYAGAEGFNRIESVASEAACMLFGAEHANVQLHSVSQANQAAYQALLNNGDRVLAMKFEDGGHLTHGMPINFSGRFFNFDFYGVDKEGFLDYDAIESQAQHFGPKLIVCGASAYPRFIDFEHLGEIAKKTNAFLMADMSHPAGLIVAHRFPQPFPSCDVVTFTPDKTMRGPHGGIILCKEELAKKLDRAVHPGVQSSVPLRRIYEIAQCLIDSGLPEFSDYIDRILRNMKVFEDELRPFPNLMVTGGSDTHLMVINTREVFGLTGVEAETVLESIGMLTNRQVMPGETLKPYVASGIRFGATWITTRGYNEDETRIVAKLMLRTLQDPANTAQNQESKEMLDALVHTPRPNDVWYEQI